MSSEESSKGVLGIGSVIAALLSWTTNHSILFCVFHTLCGWIYVIYWLATYYVTGK